MRRFFFFLSLTTAACRRTGDDTPPNKALRDTANIRDAAYQGKGKASVDSVNQLPVEITGDSAWVTVQKNPKGHSEVLVVRDSLGRWVRAQSDRTTAYP